MSITIPGLPDHLTLDQYLGLFEALSLDAKQVVELRMAWDGIHVLVFALDEHGKRIFRPGVASGGGQDAKGGHMKHRIFIPVRREADTDTRTTRLTAVGNRPVDL